MNVKLLKQVRAAILKHPDQFEMASFYTQELYFGAEVTKPGGCGTAGCIAGWAVFLATNVETLAVADRKFNGHDEAVKALALDMFETLRLFYLHHWPEPFLSRYENAETPQQRARAGADRITHFIKSKGNE